MKYNLTTNLAGTFMNNLIKKQIKDRKVRLSIKNEYKNIILRASDIGNKNKLLSSYLLAAFFIAMNRETSFTPEENIEIINSNIKKSKLIKAFLGNSSHYFSEKNMENRRKWSKATYLKKYKNDWIVDVIEKTPYFEFGLNYKECGVCKLCKDEQVPGLAKYLCRLDFTLVELIGIKLKRTKTLAEGDSFCDFRFYK